MIIVTIKITNDGNKVRIIIILVGLFRYQPRNYGKEHKVARSNGQAVQPRQIAIGRLAVR